MVRSDLPESLSDASCRKHFMILLFERPPRQENVINIIIDQENTLFH
jgi:hypothetical protein